MLLYYNIVKNFIFVLTIYILIYYFIFLLFLYEFLFYTLSFFFFILHYFISSHITIIISLNYIILLSDSLPQIFFQKFNNVLQDVQASLAPGFDTSRRKDARRMLKTYPFFHYYFDNSRAAILTVIMLSLHSYYIRDFIKAR